MKRYGAEHSVCKHGEGYRTPPCLDEPTLRPGDRTQVQVSVPVPVSLRYFITVTNRELSQLLVQLHAYKHIMLIRSVPDYLTMLETP